MRRHVRVFCNYLNSPRLILERIDEMATSLADIKTTFEAYQTKVNAKLDGLKAELAAAIATSTASETELAALKAEIEASTASLDPPVFEPSANAG